jgi:hypothetical protein
MKPSLRSAPSSPILTRSLRSADRKSKRKKTAGYILLAVLLVAVITAIILPLLLAVTIPVTFVAFGWWTYTFISGGALLDHRKRLEIAKERLSTIQPDAKPEKPFSLRLALKSKPIQLSKAVWHGRKNGHQEFLEEAWFSLEGPLLDGTFLTDEFKELQRKRTYSNPRGKRKSKSRVTYLVNVRFAYSKERYGDARPAEQALKDQTKVGPGATLRSVRVTEKAIALKALVSSDQEIARTAGMLSMGGYRILNLARKMAARQSGTQGEKAS